MIADNFDAIEISRVHDDKKLIPNKESAIFFLFEGFL